MFAIPLLVVPFLLALVPWRLSKIALRLLRGEIGFGPRGRPLLPLLTALVYLALAVDTVLLVASLVHLAWDGQWTMKALEPALWLAAAYPFVYVAAEWIFFYGLTKPRATAA